MTIGLEEVELADSTLTVAGIAKYGVFYFFRDGDRFRNSFVVRINKEPDVPGGSGAIAHPAGGFLIAFSSVCTHMGCLLVQPADDPANQPPLSGYPDELVCGPCPCHGTIFDLSRGGVVVLGPATQNLPQLKLRIEGDQLIAYKWWQERPYQHEDPREEIWPAGA